MNKLSSFALLLIGAMSLSGCGGSSYTSTNPPSTSLPPETKHVVENKAVPFYIGNNNSKTTFNLAFLDGVNDLPYLEIDEVFDIIQSIFAVSADKDFNYRLEKKDTNVVITRINDNPEALDNGTFMTVDFVDDTIAFEDFDLFVKKRTDSTLVDLISIPGYNTEKQPQLIKRVDTGRLDRYGDVFKVDLSKYNIDLIAQDGKYYIPMQTLNDILFSPGRLQNFFYNGKNLYMSNSTKGIETYFDVPTGERSKALAEYGYNELCLLFDYVYGLKEPHDIKDFSTFLYNVGLADLIREGGAELADKAVYRLISDYIDDIHSSFTGFSYLTGPINYEAPQGPSEARFQNNGRTYYTTRRSHYPNGVPGYQEVGDTAFITFDSFDLEKPFSELDYYYTVEDPNTFSDSDTIGLMMKAHYNITRENSPIKNVVMDLSVNTGGAFDAAVFVIAWFLGDAILAIKNEMTGAMSASTYRADVNRDRKFDEKDTLGDRKLYCVISPVSFSCGNLTPCVFKDSSKVTLLGKTSGGGSCSVGKGSTAWGTSFNMSSPYRMSFLKNGSFYDVDRGVEPDYAITDPNNIYDRETLVSFIDSLM